MTFRLPFQIPRVGAFCRPISPDGLVSRWAMQNGNLKKVILYHIKPNPSANLLQECKHKISYVPTRFNSTKHSININETVKKSRSKSVVKEDEASDYYQKMDEINFGPYFNREPTQAKSKMKFSKMKRSNAQLHTASMKYDYYGMENYYKEIKNIDDTMSTTANPVVSPPEADIPYILPDTELKIQNDIWKQSAPEIINNLNSKNSMWRYINGKRKTTKHDFWKDFSTSKMLTKLKQLSQATTKISAKDSRLHLVQQRLLHKTRKCKSYKERKVDVDEEKNTSENCEDSIQASACGEHNAIPDILETKNVITDCKYKISHLPLKLPASKIFVRHQSKLSKTNLQASDTYIKVNRKLLSKPNVIMATVNNRQLINPRSQFVDQYSYNNNFYQMNYNNLLYNELVAEGVIPNDSKSTDKIWMSSNETDNALATVATKPEKSEKKFKKISDKTVNNCQPNNPSSEFMEHYNYNNNFYHMNAMNDMENSNDFAYPNICYNAENYTNLLHNELVAEGVITPSANDSKSTGKTWMSTGETNNALPTVAIKPKKSEKKLKAISVKKLITKPIEKVNKMKTTNEGIFRQTKAVNVSNVQSAKAANLEELNEAVSENKPKLVKIDAPLSSKKREQKVRNKIKPSRVPKTLGEIYGVGKIPFLVEVSKPGQTKHKQYLVVIQLPKNKSQESSKNSTNSPIPLTLNTDFNDDLLKETLLSPHASLKNCFNKASGTNAGQTVPKVGCMIGLVKIKNKILPLLEINDPKRFEPLLPTKLSQLIQPKANNNKKEGDAEGTQNIFSINRLKEQCRSKDVEEQPRVVGNCCECINDQRKPKTSVIFKHARQYSTLIKRKNQKTKIPNYKIPPKIRHKNRTVEFQQKRNYGCVCCRPGCGCSCGCGCGPCPCTPCGWYPCNSCRPQCCPKFQLDYCCPRARWDCSIPIPPCKKIDAPYPSYGENMPTWCKDPTECFDYEQHILQPKNQVSPKINLMAIPKMTVVDPALQRKCYMDKWCEPCYPCVDQRICFDCPYKIPVDSCCPRGRPHCYCWPDRPCTRKPPPYRSFSDEDLEFPEVEITENDLARKFASDLYRRMGKKCKLPFAPACTVDCDLRSGEPKPVVKHDPKGHCATTCLPPNTYLAPCTPARIPPCQIPNCDTYINCCMPMEGIKKTRCAKRCCPQDCCGYCPKEPPNCCPNESSKD